MLDQIVRRVTTPTAEANQETVVITPAIASEWLEANTHNRRKKEVKIQQFAEDMKNDDWRPLAAPPIRFYEDGTLADGQNRLSACVLAGVPFESLVVWGLSKEDGVALDVGTSRSRSDVLTMNGEKNTAQLAAAIGFCWAYENEVVLRPHKKALSNQQALLWLDANPGIRYSIRATQVAGERTGLSRTALAVAHYETSLVDLDDAELFFNLLKEGENLPGGSPVLALRRWAENRRGKREKVSTADQLALILKACNAWRQGKEITNLSWRRGGAQAESFPAVWKP